MALYLVAMLFGTHIAETILASVHVRAHQQAGHMDASDLIKTLQKHLARRGPSTYGARPPPGANPGSSKSLNREGTHADRLAPPRHRKPERPDPAAPLHKAISGSMLDTATSDNSVANLGVAQLWMRT